MASDPLRSIGPRRASVPTGDAASSRAFAQLEGGSNEGGAQVKNRGGRKQGSVPGGAVRGSAVRTGAPHGATGRKGRAQGKGAGSGARAVEKPEPRGTSDPLAAQAAYLHAQALDADARAAQLRAQRDELIDRLRDEDSKRWSYTALAAALGCSRELIAQIVRRSR